MIDQLVSDGFIPEDNDYHYFNGKSLATFSTANVIREVVYVEARVDSDRDGLPDLIKVSIIRPTYNGKIPAVMTASPYHQGTNDKASDKALYKMEAELEVKEPHEITLENPTLDLVEPIGELNLLQKLKKNSLISIVATHLTTTSSQEDLPISMYQVLVPRIHKVK